MPKNQNDTPTLAPELSEREPTDAEILAGFRSRFSSSDPDGWVICPDSSQSKRRRVSELVAEEKANYLKAQRQALVNARTLRERTREEAERKTLELERARSGQSIVELKAASDAYQRWLSRRTELSGELEKQDKVVADLLADPPPETEALRTYSVAIGDAQLLRDALARQVESWEARGNEPRDALREATQAAQRDLTILYQAERERRVDGAEKALEALVDWNTLRARAPYNAPALRDIAQAARPVVELDKAVGFIGGRPGWNHSVADGELLAQVERLTELHESLASLIETV